jgi:hypothetical protein
MPDTIFRVTLVQSMYGQQIQNVFHLRGASSDPLELSAIAEDVNTFWVNVVSAEQTASLVYNGIRVRMLESQFPTFTKTINRPGAFGTDDQMLTFSAFILRLRAAEIGRRGRGRLYIAGLLKGWYVNGVVTAATITRWQLVINQLMGSYGPTGNRPYKLCIVPSKPPVEHRDVTTMSIAPTLGVQRRRNIGVGI